MEPSDYKFKHIFVFILLMAVPSFSITFNIPKDSLAFELPYGWKQIPPYIVMHQIKVLHGKYPNAPAIKYQYTFQKNSDKWFSYPYFSIQINKSGWISDEDYVNDCKKTFDSVMGNIQRTTNNLISNLKTKDIQFDSINNVVYMRMFTNIEGFDLVDAETGTIFTQSGFVSVNFYFQNDKIEDYDSLLHRIIGSVKLPEELRYKATISQYFPKDNFSVMLPGNWRYISDSELSYIRLAGGAQSQISYKYVLQISPEHKIVYPFIGISISNDGKIISSQIEETEKECVDEYNKIGLVENSEYDSLKNIIWVIGSSQNPKVGKMCFMLGLVLTSTGCMDIGCFCQYKDKDKYLPVFHKIIESTKLSPDKAYSTAIPENQDASQTNGGTRMPFEFGNFLLTLFLAVLFSGLIYLAIDLIVVHIWKKRIPTVISKLRWVFAIAAVILIFIIHYVLTASSNLDLFTKMLCALTFFAIGRELKGRNLSVDKQVNILEKSIQSPVALNATKGMPIPAMLTASGTGSIYEEWDAERLLNSIDSMDFKADAKINMQKELMERYIISFNENKYQYSTYKFDDLSEAVHFVANKSSGRTARNN